MTTEDTMAGPGATMVEPPNPFAKPNGDKPPGNSQANPSNPPGATAPKRRARKPKAVTDKEIRDALSDVLTAPAVPYSMLHMDWAADHVIRTGPEFADALVGYSKTNEWLRERLESLARGDTALGMMIAVFALATAGANYIIPQLAYLNLIPKQVGDRVAGAAIPSMPGPVSPPFTDPEFAREQEDARER